MQKAPSVAVVRQTHFYFNQLVRDVGVQVGPPLVVSIMANVSMGARTKTSPGIPSFVSANL